MAPNMAKFRAKDELRFPISLSVSLVLSFDGWPTSPAMAGSNPEVIKPNTAPSPYPKKAKA